MTPSPATLKKYFPNYKKTYQLAGRMQAALFPKGVSTGFDPMAALKVFDKAMNNHGIEAILNRSGTRAVLHYSNAGDPYRATLLYHPKSGKFRIGCWGDFVEAHPNLCQ